MKTISGRLLVITVLLLAVVSGGVGILYSGASRRLYIKEQCRMLEEVYTRLLEQDIRELCEEENRIKGIAGEDELEEQSGSFFEPYENNNLRFRIRGAEFELLYASNKLLQSGGNSLSPEQVAQNISRYEENAEARYEKNAGGRVVLRGLHEQNGSRYYIMVTQSSYVIDRSTAYARRVLFLVVGIMLLLGSVFVRFLARSIGRPVEDAARVARKIADKDFSERADEATRYRELNELGRGINEMSGQLQRYIHDLETYNQILKQDNQRRAELEQHRKRFVDNVAHELKTPLAIISGQVEMLSAAQDAQKRQRYCSTALEEISRMSDMVSSMLQIFSVEEGLERLPMEPLELGAAAEAVFQDFAPLFAGKQIRASFQKETDGIVTGNPENLRRAVSNFLMNAYRYTPRGGAVRGSVSRNGRYIIFSVYNDGQKIVEKDMDKIWNSFYQGSRAGRENEEGTGLGLYIVKSIVSQHGGVCGAENRENGVEFWFGIPADAQE